MAVIIHLHKYECDKCGGKATIKTTNAQCGWYDDKSRGIWASWGYMVVCEDCGVMIASVGANKDIVVVNKDGE